MRGLVLMIIGTISLIIAGWYFLPKIQEEHAFERNGVMSLSLTSPTIHANGTIPTRFTCDGQNVSPELIFSNIPANTQSLALTLEDPDIPHPVHGNNIWDHWVVWNIPPQTEKINEGDVSIGVTGINTSGKAAYEGPCPPDREHRYIFTLYALDTMLNLQKGSSKEELFDAIKPHIIEQAQLIGRYNRN